MIGISIKKMGINTEFCSDVNESQEFKCQCKDGFVGKRCELAICSSTYCNKNGLCFIKNDNDQLDCECNSGFEGQRCEIDLCDSVICENGSCDAGECTCDEGYINIENICKQTLCPLDCQNNRICKFEIDKNNGTEIWECACPFPFGGEKI